MAARAIPADLVLRPIAEGDVAALQTLLESDPGYTERVTGSPPGPADALSLLIGRPEGAYEDDKLVLGGWLGDDLVCVVDVLRHWPDEQTAHVGLLLVDARMQRRGLGRRALELLDDVAECWADLQLWRVAVLGTNEQVGGFWQRVGFVATGEVRPYRYASLLTQAVVYQRPARGR